MASFTYWAVWKWIAIDWSERFNFYGKDFNPNVPSLPSWNTLTCSNETSSFNLLWFQPWNEVWCYVWNVTTNWVSWRLYVESSLKRGGSTVWSYDWTYYTDTSIVWAWYMYFWVDDDEIWSSSGSYSIVTNREFRPDWWSTEWWSWITTNFIVTNLSIDSSLHPSWYLWVEWNYLCYTDAVYGSSWYKHKINYDSYTWWSGNPWYIRVPSWTSWYIYYTDSSGTVRRTHFWDERYGGNKYGTPWYIYVSDGDYTEWYGYLCFVDGNWMLRRMWNWTP